MNIMVVTNSLFFPYLKLMLFSLFYMHENVHMDVWLVYEDLTDAEINDIEMLCEANGHVLHTVYIGAEFKQKVQSRSGINIETYYRILALDMLPKEMERILYLDADMIIKGRLDELYAADIDGKAFAVCEDIFGIINGFHEANKRRMKIPAEYSYFNAGVILFNLKFLGEADAPKQMMERIYEDYERYEYNDQDVMNEMFYDRLTWMGWDTYNCPPAMYYLDQEAMREGRVVFADYETIKRAANDPEEIGKRYLNVTKQIFDQAKVIHYLGDTKPWSATRNPSGIYDIFDTAYDVFKEELEKL